MSIEAMKQALEALESVYGKGKKCNAAITALRQAIQEEALRNVARLGQEIEQEPVAWMTPTKDLFSTYKTAKTGCGFGVEPIPLYTHPPKRERVVFPTMLRKMWSGGEVQAWLDENVNKEKNHG